MGRWKKTRLLAGLLAALLFAESGLPAEARGVLGAGALPTEEAEENGAFAGGAVEPARLDAQGVAGSYTALPFEDGQFSFYEFGTGDPSADKAVTDGKLDLSKRYYAVVSVPEELASGAGVMPLQAIPADRDLSDPKSLWETDGLFPDDVMGVESQSAGNDDGKIYIFRRDFTSSQFKDGKVPDGFLLAYDDGYATGNAREGADMPPGTWLPKGDTRFFMYLAGNTIRYSQKYTIEDPQGASTVLGSFEAKFYDVKNADGSYGVSDERLRGSKSDGLTFLSSESELFYLDLGDIEKRIGREIRADYSDYGFTSGDMISLAEYGGSFWGIESWLWPINGSAAKGDPKPKLVRKDGHLIIEDIALKTREDGREVNEPVYDGYCYRVKVSLDQYETNQRTFVCNKVHQYAVPAAAIAIKTASLPSAQLGAFYDGVIEASPSNKKNKVRLELTEKNSDGTKSALPPGLSMSEAGRITGTVADADQTEYRFTVRATETDASGSAVDGVEPVEREFTIKVTSVFSIAVEGLIDNENAAIYLVNDGEREFVGWAYGKTGETQNVSVRIPPGALSAGSRLVLYRNTAMGVVEDGASSTNVSSYSDLAGLKLTAGRMLSCDIEPRNEAGEVFQVPGSLLLYYRDEGGSVRSLISGSDRRYHMPEKTSPEDMSMMYASISTYDGAVIAEYAIDGELPVTLDAAEEKLVVTIPKRKKVSAVGHIYEGLAIDGANTVSGADAGGVGIAGATISITQRSKSTYGSSGFYSAAVRTDKDGRFTADGLGEGLLTRIHVEADGYAAFDLDEFLMEDGRDLSIYIGEYTGSRDVTLMVKGIHIKGAEKEAVEFGDGAPLELTAEYDMAEMLDVAAGAYGTYYGVTAKHIGYDEESGCETYLLANVPNRAEALFITGIPGLNGDNGKISVKNGVENLTTVRVETDGYGLADWTFASVGRYSKVTYIGLDGQTAWPYLSKGRQSVMRAGTYTAIVSDDYSYYLPYDTTGKIDLEKVRAEGKAIIQEVEVRTGEASFMKGTVYAGVSRDAYAILTAPKNARPGEVYEIKGIVVPGTEALSVLSFNGNGLQQVIVDGKPLKGKLRIYGNKTHDFELGSPANGMEPKEETFAVRILVKMPEDMIVRNTVSLSRSVNKGTPDEPSYEFKESLGEVSVGVAGDLMLLAQDRISALRPEDAKVRFNGSALSDKEIVISDNGHTVAEVRSGYGGKFSGILTLASNDYYHVLTARYKDESLTDTSSAIVYCGHGTAALSDLSMVFDDGWTNYPRTVKLTPGAPASRYTVDGEVKAKYVAEFENVYSESDLTDISCYTEEQWRAKGDEAVSFNDETKDLDGRAQGKVFFRIHTTNGPYDLAAHVVGSYDSKNGRTKFESEYKGGEWFFQGTEYTQSVEVLYQPSPFSDGFEQMEVLQSPDGVSGEAAWTQDESGSWVYDPGKEFEILTNAGLKGDGSEELSGIGKVSQEPIYEVKLDTEIETGKDAFIALGTGLSELTEEEWGEIDRLNKEAIDKINGDEPLASLAIDKINGDEPLSSLGEGKSLAASQTRMAIEEQIRKRNERFAEMVAVLRETVDEDPETKAAIKSVRAVDSGAIGYSDERYIVEEAYIDFASAVNELSLAGMGYEMIRYSVKEAGTDRDIPTRAWCAITSYTKDGRKIQPFMDTNMDMERPASTLETYLILNPEVEEAEKKGTITADIHPYKWTRIQIARVAPGGANPIYPYAFVAPLATWTPKPRYKAVSPIGEADSRTIPKLGDGRPMDDIMFTRTKDGGMGIKTTIEPGRVSPLTYISGAFVIYSGIQGVKGFTKLANGTLQKANEKAVDYSAEWVKKNGTEAYITNCSTTHLQELSGGLGDGGKSDVERVEDYRVYFQQERIAAKSDMARIKAEYAKINYKDDPKDWRYKADKLDRQLAKCEERVRICDEGEEQMNKAGDYLQLCEDHNTMASKTNSTVMWFGLLSAPCTYAVPANAVGGCANTYISAKNDSMQSTRSDKGMEIDAYVNRLKQRLIDLEYGDDEEEKKTPGGGGDGEDPGEDIDETIDDLNGQIGKLDDDIGTLDPPIDDLTGQINRTIKEIDILKISKEGSGGGGRNTKPRGMEDEEGTIDDMIRRRQEKLDSMKKELERLKRERARKQAQRDALRRKRDNKIDKRNRAKQSSYIQSSTTKNPTNENPDPSGYVYEAVLSNPVAGAKVTLYNSDLNGKVGWTPEYAEGDLGVPMAPSNLDEIGDTLGAETLAYADDLFPQTNSMLTDSKGYYQWYVPQGLWYVTAEKDGYEQADSQGDVWATAVDKTTGRKWLPVLPQQTRINIPMVDRTAPTADASFDADGITLAFSKYMDEKSLGMTGDGHVTEMTSTDRASADAAPYLDAYYTLVDGDGKKIPFSVTLDNSEQAPDNIDYGDGAAPWYASRIRLSFLAEVAAGSSVTLSLKAGDGRFVSYAGTAMEESVFDGAVPERAQVVEAPVFSPVDGSIEPGEKVSISCATEGAQIWYGTLFDGILGTDGKLDREKATAYTGAFAPASGETYVAMAVKEGLPDSSIGVATFTVNSFEVGAIPDHYYTGSKVTLSSLDIRCGGVLLTEGIDYTLAYKDNKNVGTAKVQVKGKGGYTGVLYEGSFAIRQTDIDDACASNLYVKTGKKELPKLTYGTSVLKKDRDYTLDESKVDYGKEGTYELVVTGKGGYTGSKSISVVVGDAPKKLTSIKKCSIEVKKSVEYDGSVQKPDVKVSDNGKELTGGKDYKLLYSGSSKVGSGFVVITGIGDYEGIVKKSFKIAKFNLKAASDEALGYSVTLGESAVYAKSGARPEMALSLNGNALREGTDYTVKVTKANAGATGKLTVRGKGNFTGSFTHSFKVEAAPLSDLILLAAPPAYKNKAGNYKAKVTVLDKDGKKLTAGKDYDKGIVYEYADGGAVPDKEIVPAGTDLVARLTAKGGYTGTAEVSFKLVDAGKDISRMKFKAGGVIYQPGGGEAVLKKTDIQGGGGATFEVVEGSYVNNRKVGTARVTLKGTGDYGGFKTISFKVAKRQK